MRSKDEIMLESTVIMNKIPADGKEMVMHEHLFLEAWLDIRDILKDLLKNIGTNLFDHAKES